MTADARWLHQGFFVLGDDQANFTRAVRDELQRSLGLAFRIGGYPNRQAWRHTVWWREGDQNYAEAQFFARISKEYPVLSMGVSVEKGIEGPVETSDEEMDRQTWHWPRFVQHAEDILSSEVRAVSANLGQPISLRIKVWREAAETRAFSLVNGQWYERHRGTVNEADIARYIADLDGRQASWVDAYIAQDLAPRDADRLTTQAASAILLTFDGIRRRLGGVVQRAV